jgi:hypothetical protein
VVVGGVQLEGLVTSVRTHRTPTINLGNGIRAQFRYLGTPITNQSLIQKEFKKRLKSDIICYHSVKNLLSSRLLSKKHKN